MSMQNKFVKTFNKIGIFTRVTHGKVFIYTVNIDTPRVTNITNIPTNKLLPIVKANIKKNKTPITPFAIVNGFCIIRMHNKKEVKLDLADITQINKFYNEYSYIFKKALAIHVSQTVGITPNSKYGDSFKLLNFDSLLLCLNMIVDDYWSNKLKKL